jgi:hypothetical protein
MKTFKKISLIFLFLFVFTNIYGDVNYDRNDCFTNLFEKNSYTFDKIKIVTEIEKSKSYNIQEYWDGLSLKNNELKIKLVKRGIETSFKFENIEHLKNGLLNWPTSSEFMFLELWDNKLIKPFSCGVIKLHFNEDSKYNLKNFKNENFFGCLFNETIKTTEITQDFFYTKTDSNSCVDFENVKFGGFEVQRLIYSINGNTEFLEIAKSYDEKFLESKKKNDFSNFIENHLNNLVVKNNSIVKSTNFNFFTLNQMKLTEKIKFLPLKYALYELSKLYDEDYTLFTKNEMNLKIKNNLNEILLIDEKFNVEEFSNLEICIYENEYSTCIKKELKKNLSKLSENEIAINYFVSIYSKENLEEIVEEVITVTNITIEKKIEPTISVETEKNETENSNLIYYLLGILLMFGSIGFVAYKKYR